MEEWEQEHIEREYIARAEKTRAETKLIEKQIEHMAVVADLANSEKDRAKATIAIELKRQINELGHHIAEYEAQLPVVLKEKEDLASYICHDGTRYEQRRDLWRIDEWLAKNQASYDFTLKQIDNLKTQLLQHLTKEA